MGKSHVSSNNNDALELWKELKGPNDTKVTLKGLLAKMKGDNTPNFVRPFALYTIGKYVCPITQQYVDNGYLGIVRNVETIKSTNFGRLTLDHLMASVRKFVNGGSNLEGNLPLLQDEEDRAISAACKENLKNVSQLYKELDASQGTKSNHRSAKAKGIKEPEEPHVFPIAEDNYDDSLAKQRQDSVVDSILPTCASSRKRVVSSLLSNEDYGLYDSDKKRQKNRTPSESTNDSKDTNNTKRKNRARSLKDTDTGASRLETDLDKFQQIYVAEIVNTSDLDKQLVVIDDIVLLHTHLKCLTMTDGGEDDKWLGHEIMHHDHHKDIREGQLVYIERVAGVAMLERDGKVENCHEAALAAVMEQKKETTTSDMICFPTYEHGEHQLVPCGRKPQKEGDSDS
ncbi:hypothetical protein D1007_58576 [Hordeum vulgare]|nr:hypothetical protein D1007_58576 [Hordeum vulgare]